MVEDPLTASALGIGQKGIEGYKIPNQRIPIILAVLPGERGTLLAETFGQNCDFNLLRFAYSSEDHHFQWNQFGNNRIFCATTRIWPTDIPDGTIVVDYLPPELGNNYQFYADKRLSFVAGVSSNAEAKVLSAVENSAICAVAVPLSDDCFATTLAAVDFLSKQMKSGAGGQVFSIADVLMESATI